ncbi:MAG: glutaredoxin family protein [Dehalococcoidia bacterium]|nr:glutaredoxin family protein [Dehalococcoidia bacterium]
MFCHKVQEFLAGKGIPFESRDVSQDERAVNELIDLGYQTTPVTVIDGEIVIGFDRKRIEELLKGYPGPG